MFCLYEEIISAFCITKINNFSISFIEFTWMILLFQLIEQSCGLIVAVLECGCCCVPFECISRMLMLGPLLLCDAYCTHLLERNWVGVTERSTSFIESSSCQPRLTWRVCQIFEWRRKLALSFASHRISKNNNPRVFICRHRCVGYWLLFCD